MVAQRDVARAAGGVRRRARAQDRDPLAPRRLRSRRRRCAERRHDRASTARVRLAPKARLRFDARSGKHVLLYPERGLELTESAARIAALCVEDRAVERSSTSSPPRRAPTRARRSRPTCSRSCARSRSGGWCVVTWGPWEGLDRSAGPAADPSSVRRDRESGERRPARSGTSAVHAGRGADVPLPARVRLLLEPARARAPRRRARHRRRGARCSRTRRRWACCR